MMKYSKILALFAALTLVFVFAGCGEDAPATSGIGDAPPAAVTVAAADIKLNPCGGGQAAFKAEGNKIGLEATNPTSHGIYIDFPKDVIGKKYDKVAVTFKLLSLKDIVSDPERGPGANQKVVWNCKSSTQLSTDVNLYGEVGANKNEIEITTAGVTGEWPFKEFTDRIVWQFNAWQSDSGGAVAFTVEVSKIEFLP